MAHSREVRLPFLYHELVEFVFRLPSEYKIKNGWTKALLRYSLADVLPAEITWRKNKLGFAPPQKKWEKSKIFAEYAFEYKNLAVNLN
jgi:Asparagine synthase (glutamine-hydrolyzing)